MGCKEETEARIENEKTSTGRSHLSLFSLPSTEPKKEEDSKKEAPFPVSPACRFSFSHRWRLRRPRQLSLAMVREVAGPEAALVSD